MMFAKLLARDIRLGFVRLLPYYIGAVLLGAVLGFGAVALSKVAIGDAAAFTLGDIVAETFDHPVPIDWWQVMQGRPVSLSFEFFRLLSSLLARLTIPVRTRLESAPRA